MSSIIFAGRYRYAILPWIEKASLVTNCMHFLALSYGLQQFPKGCERERFDIVE
jgi:hypothetical protein